MSATCENKATAKEWLEAVALWAEDQRARAESAGEASEADAYDDCRGACEDAIGAITDYSVEVVER